jgi:hypothetical protein
MDNIDIKGSKGAYFIPSVSFNAETGVCELSGESFLEDTIEFYTPILDWLKEYMKTGKPIVFNLSLTYFNTSSSRSILEILRLLKKYQSAGNDVTVNWYFDEKDIDMEEEIEDYIIESNLDINKITM